MRNLAVKSQDGGQGKQTKPQHIMDLEAGQPGEYKVTNAGKYSAIRGPAKTDIRARKDYCTAKGATQA